MAYNTLVTLNQVIEKNPQDHQIWDINDGVILPHKYIQIKQLRAMKESTPGINNDIGITINLAKNFARNIKE